MRNVLYELILNKVLISAIIAWSLAQWIKLPIEYFLTGRWNWSLLFSTGGMPSSHSALVSGASFAIGLFYGFDTPIFALALVTSMIVLYDAAGVRRQAGLHATKINHLINEFFKGHPISEEQLKELLGHTPRQVLVGTLLGILIATIVWLIWR